MSWAPTHTTRRWRHAVYGMQWLLSQLLPAAGMHLIKQVHAWVTACNRAGQLASPSATLQPPSGVWAAQQWHSLALLLMFMLP
jgi:hypothetical protein